MLVLARKAKDKIVVTDKTTNEEIIISIISVKGKVSRLGIEASKKYHIVREELSPKELSHERT